ncbi:TolC family protein [soil metagenome]
MEKQYSSMTTSEWLSVNKIRSYCTLSIYSALLLLSAPKCALADLSPSSIAWQEPKSSSAKVRPLLINQAFDETLLRSPRAAAIRSQLGIARSSISEATVMANPVLNLDNGFLAEQTYLITVSVPIELPWKLALRLLTAKRQITQTELEIGRNLWLLRADVRRAYTEVAVAQETAETLVELATLAKRLENIAENRFKVGNVADLDVQKALLANWQADIDKQQGLTRVTQAKQQLNVLLGRNFSSNITVPQLPMTFQLRAERSDLLPDFDKSLPAVQSLIDQAMQNRLDLKALTQAIKVNETSLKSSYGKILPNPVMTFGHATTGNPPSGPRLYGYHVTANVELPILDRQQGDIARLKATISSLKADCSAAKNTIVGEVCAAYQKMVIARTKIGVYQERVLAQSSKVARMGRLSYEAGQSDITSALAAQQANIQVRGQYLAAVNDYQLAITDLEQAIGLPLQI